MACNICGEGLPYCSKHDCDVCEGCICNILNDADWCLECDEKESCSLYNNFK